MAAKPEGGWRSVLWELGRCWFPFISRQGGTVGWAVGEDSPDVAALVFWADHCGVGFATPGFLELWKIGERTDNAVLGDGMGIALHHEALGFGSDFVAPELAPGDEELLLRGEAVAVGGARLARQ